VIRSPKKKSREKPIVCPIAKESAIKIGGRDCIAKRIAIASLLIIIKIGEGITKRITLR
jgi:hypothetical protein